MHSEILSRRQPSVLSASRLTTASQHRIAILGLTMGNHLAKVFASSSAANEGAVNVASPTNPMAIEAMKAPRNPQKNQSGYRGDP
jgi:esterase/lipase